MVGVRDKVISQAGWFRHTLRPCHGPAMPMATLVFALREMLTQHSVQLATIGLRSAKPLM